MNRLVLFLIGLLVPLWAGADSPPQWRQTKGEKEPEKKPALNGTGLVPAGEQEPLPPPSVVAPKKLPELDGRKTERPTMPSSDDELEAERQRLRQQMLELIKKLGDKKPEVTPGPKPKETKEPAPLPQPKIDITASGTTAEKIRLAQNLYRINDTSAAYLILKAMDASLLSKDDRPFVQYLTASCLRRLGKLNEAAQIYREISEAKEDEFLAECAVWQVSQIRSLQEIEAQLQQLRSRNKSK